MPDDPNTSSAGSPSDLDPLYLHARRELIVSLAAMIVFGVWVVGFSWIQGLRPETQSEQINTVLGIPSWVFWGVALPWILANLFTFWFCFRFMTDNALEVVEEEQSTEESKAGGVHD